MYCLIVYSDRLFDDGDIISAEYDLMILKHRFILQYTERNSHQV